MSYIRETIERENENGKKALAVYLTAGYPHKDSFVDLACGAIEAGADIIELGVPFSDPLADGPVIQESSYAALKNGINLHQTLVYAKEIKKRFPNPIILMGYLNPIIKMGVEKFISEARERSVDGLIIPDLPLEEHVKLIDNRFDGIDVTLLTTPTSSKERIGRIDEASQGFIYCVSVVGTTGVRSRFSDDTMANLKRTYEAVKRNKMMIGFGISNGDDVKRFSPFCDGVIVGSAIIKSLQKDKSNKTTFELIANLKSAC
ncbi:MAG: tryptophan synthase subunit alpha [Bacteroidetes bacterium]|nr:tryptophan synthase subunit alpha [Bacteroidota bacterium]